MKREPLKAGDRVAMYSGAGRSTGTIFARHDDQVEVTGDASELTTTWHPKQLRRLKRRERRRIWVAPLVIPDGQAQMSISLGPIKVASLGPIDGYVEFIEARPRKERGK